MKNTFFRFEVAVCVVAILFLCSTVAWGEASRLDKIELGIILSTEKEDHCFILGSLGLSEEKSKDYLSGLGHELAFSKELEPAWPDWDFVRVAAVYCRAGLEGAEALVGMMEDPSGVVMCKSLDELLENCNCVMLINTGGTGDDNYELVSTCIEAGRPIFVDKFLASDLSEARTLLDLAEKEGVPLVSSSYIWTSQPGIELKEKIKGKKLKKVTSSGWSGGKITGGIHTIAQMQLLSGDRRPTSVHVEEGKTGDTVVVIFEDGLAGEMIPRREGKIFEVEAEADGEVFKADVFEGKHSRPSAINLFGSFFDFVRGKNQGQPSYLVEDAVAIWEAAERAKATEAPVEIQEVFAESAVELFEVGEIEFLTPTVAHPYYRFAMPLELPERGEVYVHDLEGNGEVLRNYSLVETGEVIDPGLPNNLRRLAIAEALKSIRPEASFQKPILIGRLDWENGKPYKIKTEISIGDKKGKRYWAQARGIAPSAGGYWNPAWKHYQSVVVTETAGRERVAEPVEVTYLFYSDQIVDSDREIRVVRYHPEKKTHTEVPCQVMDFDRVDVTEAPMYDENGKRKPATFLATGSATVVFPADVEPNSSSVYLVFYGNPDAEVPDYTSELKVSGPAPGVTVENDVYLYKLHDLTGMLDEVTLKAKPAYEFVHKKETNGAIQWNPGCYAPPRPWAHLSDWEPGKYDFEYEERRGPLVFSTRRSGIMPTMPELWCSMEYKFYAGVPYYTMRSSVHVRHDVAVQALRNSEIVFSRESFGEAAWFDPITRDIETRTISAAPDLTEWTMPDDTPWIAFYDSVKGCGFAGIQREYMNAGLNGKLRTLNPYLYITTGPWVYWTRALIYPYGSRNPQQMMNVLAGSVFLDEWGYLPFELREGEKERFKDVTDWQVILANPLQVHLEDPIDIRMQVPEEIYIEPQRTGWEGQKTEE
jgi:hypothetical protein